jgi:hypothetical protein
MTIIYCLLGIIALLAAGYLALAYWGCCLADEYYDDLSNGQLKVTHEHD